MAGHPAKGPIPIPPLKEVGLGPATKAGRPLHVTGFGLLFSFCFTG